MCALAGCGGGSSVDRTPAVAPCETVTPAGHPADTVTVVLFDQVDLSHAPWGRNREERFVFSHLYETLVTINCRGEARTGPLSKSVIEASDGWLVELRDDVRFWDESPVTPHDVVESFAPAIRDGLAIKSVDVIDEHSFLVRGPSGRPDIKLLALPMLAIRKTTERPGPPMGTGPWMIDESAPVAEAVFIRPVATETPTVRFIQGNVSDARDIMDGTADAMITDDPAAIEYARSKKDALAPLAWDRAYVFVSASRELSLHGGATVENLPEFVCESIARDAVDVDARGGSHLLAAAGAATQITIGWSELPSPNHQVLSERVVYPRGDQTARSLAERIVAIAAMDTASSTEAHALAITVPELPRGLRVVALNQNEFEEALSQARDAGYVLSLSWNRDFPHVKKRFSEAPWLFHTGRPLSDVLVPLIETRAHFIAISDRIGFVDDHAGDVRILIPTREMRH